MSKNARKSKPDSTPEMPLDGKGVKPVENKFARAVQMEKEFTPGFADAALRRLAKADNLNPATGQPWIPAPIKGHYEIAPTVRGVIAWLKHQSDHAGELPAQFANMQAMENALGTQKRAIKWLLKNGAGQAQDAANRIAPLPVIQRAFDIVAQVSDGAITGIDGLDEWNKDTELAKKLRLESEKMEDEKLLRRGEMLLSKDGNYAIHGLIADEWIWEKRDQPLRAALLVAPKNINRQIKTILSDPALNTQHSTVITRCSGVVMAEIKTVLDKVRAKKPVLAAGQIEK